MKDEVTEVPPGDFPIRRGRRSSAAWINRRDAQPDTSSVTRRKEHMKSFFENLFGRKPPSGVIRKPAEPALVSSPQQPLFELNKKGDVIAGKYEVQRLLGKGGFGVVYLVQLRETGEAFALKTFKDELMANPAAHEAFKKEALVWVNLERHPFILPALWVEEVHHGRTATADESGKLIFAARHAQEVSGRLFVVMDYVAADAQGRANLGDYLAGGPLDKNQVLKWGIQFCLGMEHARAHGVECHRDIKPANIMITQDGTLKVTDFGLAIATEAAWREASDRVGSAVMSGKDGDFGFSVMQADGKLTCGTPGYIAPEVYRSEGANIRSDIYSFGLVLWQMAAGSRVPPFNVPWRSDMETYMRAIYEEQMAGRVSRMNGSLGSVIARCLRPRHSERYGTFQELRAALEPILEQRTGQRFEVPDVGGKTASFWNNKGGSLAALGRHEEAIRCYDEALAIDRSAIQVLNNKGSALSALGRSEEAIGCYDKALAIDSRFIMALHNKGRDLHILGQHEEAIRCYDKALSIDSRDTEAWLSKGSVLTSRSQHENALVCYDRALAIDPKNLDACYNKGLSLLKLGKDAEAVASFDRALGINPLFEMAWVNKGNVLATHGRYEDAVACCDKAIAVNSRNTDTFTTKATLLAAMGKCEEAIVCCDHALAVDSRNASAWAGKGAVLASLAKREEAASCYDKALAIEPRSVVAWCGKGSALGATGRHREAISCFEQALTIDPKNAAALFGKAMSEDAERRWRDAAISYRKFIELATPMYGQEIASAKKRLHELANYDRLSEGASTPEIWIKKGVALNEAGRIAEAVVCYDRALALDSENASVWYWKGCALAKMNRHEDAVSSYRNAIRLDPKSAAPWFNMGHCMGLLGCHQDVIECCDRALEINPQDSQVWMLKGVGFCSMERYEEAIRCFQEAEKLGDASAAIQIANCRRLQSPNAETWFRRGSDFQEAGNNAEAIRCYEAGLAIDASNPDVWINKGAALLALDRGPEAIACFDHAIALKPDAASAWNNKGIALMSLGQSEDGLVCLTEAYRLRGQGAGQ